MDSDLAAELVRMEGRIMARIETIAEEDRRARREHVAWQEAQTRATSQLVQVQRKSAVRQRRILETLRQPPPTKIAPPENVNAILVKLLMFAFVLAVVAGIAGMLGHTGLALLLKASGLPVPAN